MNLDGIRSEYGLQARLTHRGHRGTSSVQLGHVFADGGGFNQAGADAGYSLTDRLQANAHIRYNDQTLDSAYFRALGTRDSLGAGFDYLLTARDTISFNAQGLRYQSRWNDFLGSGYELDSSLSHALKSGQTYELSVYANASYVHNDLVDSLPASLAARLPAGSDLNTVLPGEFGFAGVGIAISRGQPGSAYPLVAGLRYHADLGIGYTWPDNRPAVSFNAALGHRVLGSDELSVFFGVDQTQAETGGTSLSLGLRYRYFFGK